MPFWSAESTDALFKDINANFNSSENRQLIEIPHLINAPEFAAEAAAQLRSIT